MINIVSIVSLDTLNKISFPVIIIPSTGSDVGRAENNSCKKQNDNAQSGAMQFRRRIPILEWDVQVQSGGLEQKIEEDENEAAANSKLKRCGRRGK